MGQHQPHLDKYAQQLDTERLQVDLGVQRYRSEKPLPWRDGAGAQKEETDLPPGKKLLIDSIKPVAEAFEEWRNKANSGAAGRRHTAVPYLQTIHPYQAAYIAARTIINGATMRETFNTLTSNVGRAIEKHLDFVRFEQEQPKLFNVIERQLEKSTSAKHRNGVLRAGMRLAKLDVGEWDSATYLRVGEVLFDLFVTNTGLVETYTTTKTKHRRLLRVKPTEACIAWLEKQHGRCELLSPIYLPMVVPPRKWTNPFDGGYLDSQYSGIPLVKTRNRQYLEDLSHVEMPKVYDAVNAVQETPWRVNKAVLGVMREVWDGGGSLGGLPAREDLPLPARPADIDTNPESLKAWKQRAARVYEQNARLRSKRLAQMQKLWMAEKFADEEAIYFPHSMDFRGRLYPVVPFVNPQGDDSGKSLIEFAEGKRLGEYGGYWLAVHIANLFGVDKASFDDRVAWTQENEELILDSAMRPLDGNRFWTQADSPYCALAACFEWAGFRIQGEDYVSHLPIALDGSCSGIQHFSAMLRDSVGGAAVNLLPQEKPADIYTQVAKAVQAAVDKSPDPDANPWKDGKVVRKIAKQPTMTLSYGATERGMQGQIENALHKLDEDHPGGYLEGTSNREASVYMAGMVYRTIGDVVVAARTAMDWLKKVARIAAEDGLPIRWTTPVGFPVVQEYKRSASRRVNCFVGGQRHYVTISEQEERLDRRRQASGISPNFVHSLDAAHLMSTVVTCKEHGINSFAMIHDSFGTHAGNIDEMAFILRQCFIEQYTPNILEKFREEIASQLPEKLAKKLPKVPKMGTLELEAVLDSQYFFA
jgi:DNA-directed RNA polymerase